MAGALTHLLKPAKKAAKKPAPKKAPARKRPTTKAGREAARRAKPAASMGEAVDRALASLTPITLAPGELQKRLDEAAEIGHRRGRENALIEMERQRSLLALKKLQDAEIGPHDHHMDGDERKPGLGDLCAKEIECMKGRRAMESAHNELVDESARRRQGVSIPTRSAHVEINETIRRVAATGTSEAVRPAASGAIAAATDRVNGALRELFGITAMVEHIGDAHLGSVDGRGDPQGTSCTPDGRIAELHTALTELERQIARLAEQAQRLNAL